MDNYTDRGYNNLLSVDSTKDISGGINLGNLGSVSDSAFGFNKLNIRTLYPNQNIETDDFVSGTSGWQIKGDGNVEFNNGVFRGTLTATAGSFGSTANYWNIGSTGITAVSTSGDVVIKYGKTDFGQDSTSGFILGYDYSATASKFEIGSSASKIFKYNGTNFTLTGGTITGGTIQTSSVSLADKIVITDTGSFVAYEDGISRVNIDASSANYFISAYASGTIQGMRMFSESASSANILEIDASGTSGIPLYIDGSIFTGSYIFKIDDITSEILFEGTSSSGSTIFRTNQLDVDKNGIFITNSTSASAANSAIVEIKEYSSGLPPLKLTGLSSTCLILDGENQGVVHIKMTGITGDSSSAEGDFWYDSLAHKLKYRDNSGTKTIAVV